MRRMCRHKHNSGEIARHRLKMLLISDKVHCSPRLLEMVKDEMINVLSKYMEIDSGHVELEMTRMETAGARETMPALFANIPIRAIPNKGID